MYTHLQVRVCDNLKQNIDEVQSVYQSGNNGMDSQSSYQQQQPQQRHQEHTYFEAGGIYGSGPSSRELHSNSSAVFRTDEAYSESTYQNNTRLRESRAPRERENGRSQSGRGREESPYYERRLPSPDVVSPTEEQVYRKLPINKVLPTAFLPNVALREVPKDKNGNVSTTVSPNSVHSHSPSNSSYSPPLLRSSNQAHQNRAKSYPSPSPNGRYTPQQQVSLPSGVPRPPSGPAPDTPTVYGSHAPRHNDYDNHDHDDIKPVIMKGTKDEEIVHSFSGINLSTANKSFDMNNLHEALGYLPWCFYRYSTVDLHVTIV